MATTEEQIIALSSKAADEAFRRMCAPEGYGCAFFLYFKRAGMELKIAREDETPEGFELATPERIPSSLTQNQLATRFCALVRKLPILRPEPFLPAVPSDVAAKPKTRALVARTWSDQPRALEEAEVMAEMTLGPVQAEIRKAVGTGACIYVTVGTLFGSQTVLCPDAEAALRFLGMASRQATRVQRGAPALPVPAGCTLMDPGTP